MKNKAKNKYIEQRDEGYWVAGTRVSLDSIVYAYWGGQTAESIAQSFPVLTLEQVYGTITFYLANQTVINPYLSQNEADFDKIDKGFHPDFELIGIGEGGTMWHLTIKDWKERVKKRSFNFSLEQRV